MNSPNPNPEAIRSDIDDTRRRMNDTMDALGERLEPRHLVDEFLGFLRGEDRDGESRLNQMRDKVTQSASAAMHSVVDTVKKNPMPALLIGAGVAWMIYESRRDRTEYSPNGDYYGLDREGDQIYDPELHHDRPLQYPAGSNESAENGDQTGSRLGEMKDTIAEKASSATGHVKEKLSHAGEAVREKAGALREQAGEKLHQMREKAGDMTARMKESTRHAYDRTRERVVTTADHHPLEVGLISLAAGIIAGLALPTPNAVNRRVGPTADRLRQRTREAGTEMLEKGKRVARVAVNAVKDEAQAQGLTPEHLREKVGAVADRAKETVEPDTRQEGAAFGGMPPGSLST